MNDLAEFDCPKCEEEGAFRISFASSDNGLPGSYFRAFLEPDVVERDCKCEFTQSEMNEFLVQCAEREEENIMDANYD